MALKRLFEQGADVAPNLLDRVASGRAGQPTKNHTWQKVYDWLKDLYDLVYVPKFHTNVGFAKINIGTWNMDADETKTVDITSVCADSSNVIEAIAYIYPDNAGFQIVKLEPAVWNGSSVAGGVVQLTQNSTYLTLKRIAGGEFDSISYNDSIINRGYLLITYLL